MSRETLREPGTNGSVFDTTSLPQLPPGWCWATLDTIAEIEGGITKDQQRHRTDTMREVPYLRVANVQRGFLDLSEVKTILADEATKSRHCDYRTVTSFSPREATGTS